MTPRPPRKLRLYDDLAYLWPMISPPSDYQAEADLVRDVLQSFTPMQTIIEFGAGGGHTLSHLVNDYHVVAMDCAPAMLEQCEQLIPNVETIVADMRTARLNRTFDAVLIHDAIDYMLTPTDVQQTLATAATHLSPGAGGVSIIAPTYTTETFVDGDSAQDTCHSNTLELFYTSRTQRTSETTFDMVLTYQITEAGQTRTLEDRHPCGLFPLEQWATWLHTAGFNVEHRETEAWSLFVAIQR